MFRDVKPIILFGLVLLKCVLGGEETKNSIIIMTPHVWICDQFTTHTLLIDTVSDTLRANNISVSLNLKSRTDSSRVAFNDIKTVRANSNGFHRFDLELPERIETGFYDLEVNVSTDNGYDFFGSLANLECRTTQNGIYIITDKPVYKDSEKVRIRVVNIDSNLLPVSDQSASIYIMDPNKNRIQQFLNVNFTNGLIDGLEFKLTDRPIYGDWEIKVVFNETEKFINFNVKEYVLPKFDFKLNMPDYIIRNSKEIKGSVEAKYTYGKPLEGDVLIRLENQFYGPYVIGNDTTYQSGTAIQYEQAYTLNKGKIDFAIPFKSSDYSYNYKINVTVTDKYSDESSSKESYLNIIWNEFYTRLDNYDFSPNQTNFLKVDLVQPNEKPYAFKKLNVTIVQKSIDYSVSYNYKTLSNDSFFLTTDVNGRLNFRFFAESNATSVEITFVSADDPTQIGYVYLYKRNENQFEQPELKEKLIIKPESNDTQLELDSIIGLRLIRNDTDKCVTARYFVLGKLRVLMNSVIELCDETTIYLDLGADYAPYSTLVVYYVDPATKNVTVASYEIKIDNFFRNHLEIAFSSNTTQPGEDVEIELYTKEKSLVSLCIIDKSVELLRQPNELTINDINTQMLSTRLYGYYPPYPNPQLTRANQFNRMVFPRPGYWQLTESLRKLHNQGLIVASDLDSLFANFTACDFNVIIDSILNTVGHNEINDVIFFPIVGKFSINITKTK